MMTIKELKQACNEISRWLEWDTETINDFHAFAQQFGSTPGSNVYTFVLTEALRARGLTLEQFKHQNLLADIKRCPECKESAAHSYSDATTPGFFYVNCAEHRKALKNLEAQCPND